MPKKTISFKPLGVKGRTGHRNKIIKRKAEKLGLKKEEPGTPSGKCVLGRNRGLYTKNHHEHSSDPITSLSGVILLKNYILG